MKIAILTIHNAHNYGAIFQAYATQVALSKYGEVKVIDYQNPHIKEIYSLFSVKLNKTLPKSLVRDLLLLGQNLKRRKRFNAFINTRLSLTDEVLENSQLPSGYDVYVSGSDQIWHPGITNGVDVLNKDYFLANAPAFSKKISYASSLGNYRYSAEQEKEVKTYLTTFDCVAVREKDGADYLSNVLGKSVIQVLDPTLLLSKEEWVDSLNLEAKHEEGEYILVYTVPRSPMLRKVVEYYSNMDIKIVSIDPALRGIGNVDKQVRDAGPVEFLNLFLGAKMIITDSFHGVCFSINFKKDFLAVSSGAISNRMRNILDITGMTTRLIEEAAQLDKVIPVKDEEFDVAHERLSKSKELSFEYLSRALL